VSTQLQLIIIIYEAFSGETHEGIALPEGQDTVKDIPNQC
jgi:hypothetical protein